MQDGFSNPNRTLGKFLFQLSVGLLKIQERNHVGLRQGNCFHLHHCLHFLELYFVINISGVISFFFF